MKKFSLTILFILLTSTVYAQTADEQKLRDLNELLVASFQKQDLKNATKYAEEALELSLKSNELKRSDIATAYSNLGVIYQSRRKYSDSIENLEKALEIYKAMPQSVSLANTYKVLATSYYYDSKKSEAETYFLKALEVLENLFGENNKELFKPTLSIAKLYASDEQYIKADEYYLKSYAIGLKSFGKDSDEIDVISDARTCAMINRDFKSKAEYEKDFEDKRVEILGIDVKYQEIINGKAKSLPKPYYPREARGKRFSNGKVAVKVIIDENGNVTEAKAICGNTIFNDVTEEAAKKAKFGVTYADGKPIEVTGTIIYNFK